MGAMAKTLMILILVSLMSPLGVGCHRGPSSPADCLDDVSDPGPLARHYIAFGDSLTEGYGDAYLEDGKGYPDTLSALLNRTVYNEGIGGERTGQGKGRISNVLAAHPDAEYVLIMEGANDLWWYIPFEDMVDAVHQMVLICLGNRRIPVILAVPPTLDGFQVKIDLLNDTYREYCKQNGLLFIEGYCEQLRQRTDVFEPNWVHLNDAGYKVLAQDVAEELVCAGYYQ
jgi:lysophospholipase L1-like esterase